jgi:iron complex outermembrane receptor protein
MLIKQSLINTLLISLLFTQNFLADSKSTEETEPDRHEQLDNTERLLITGSRFNAENLIAPESISVVNQADIQLVSHTHINELLSQVSGTWISRGNGQEHLTAIRSAVLTGSGACGAFFMSEDGISLRAQGFCNVNQLFDAHSEQAQYIDVIKGPASVTYGSNALHGVINIINPSIEQIQPKLSIEAGSNDYYRTKLAVKSQLSESHSVGLLTTLNNSGGYQEQSGYDQQKITLLHDFLSDEFSAKTRLTGSNLNQETAGFLQGFNIYRDDQLNQQNLNPEAYRDSQSLRLSSELSWQLGNNKDFTLTPFYRDTSMEFIQHYLPWKAVETNGHKSIGVKSLYRSQSNQFSWAAGLDVELTEGTLSEYQAEPFSATIPMGMHYNYQVDAVNISPFIDSLWQVNNDLSLSAGVRFDRLTYDYNNRLTDGNSCESTVSNCRFTRPADEKSSFNDFSPRLGLSYQLNPELSSYITVSKGFRAPQATELYRLQAGQQTADLSSVEMSNFEIGLRSLSTSFEYQLSIFSMTKDNVIFRDTSRLYLDTGKTSHQGIELDLSVVLSENFELNFNTSYTKHHYDNAINIANTSIKGNSIDTAPEWLGSASLKWRPENVGLWQLQWQYLDDYWLEPSNQFKYIGHKLWHLRGNIALNETTSLQIRLQNLTDENYAERADYGFGSYRYFIGLPRSLYLGITIKL